ncbi:MAG: hypothetical protein Ct9H300mP11_08010 [Chloroflexota bacterium]|nr:MAG: hypothetical protein Ct9H300mP11_08010 [Chloroflexota bacterium]
MPDKLGWRANWGVIAPSTNTSVQPKFERCPPEASQPYVTHLGS